jgi:hypothetical protein
MRVAIANWILAGFLVGMMGFSVFTMRREIPHTACGALAREVAELELERDAARKRGAYVVLDATSQQIALVCRGIVLWRQPVRCDAAALQRVRSGQKLVGSPSWDGTVARADSARALPRATHAASKPVAPPAPAPATPIAKLDFDAVRLRFVTPRPAPPAPTNRDLVREWLQQARGAPEESRPPREVEVEITLAAARTLCDALAEGSMLLLQPLGAPAASAPRAGAPIQRSK